MRGVVHVWCCTCVVLYICCCTCVVLYMCGVVHVLLYMCGVVVCQCTHEQANDTWSSISLDQINILVTIQWHNLKDLIGNHTHKNAIVLIV